MESNRLYIGNGKCSVENFWKQDSSISVLYGSILLVLKKLGLNHGLTGLQSDGFGLLQVDFCKTKVYCSSPKDRNWQTPWNQTPAAPANC